MLAPDGRAILLDALRPPEGYVLGFAVATTFTLDLPAALVVPLAFATSQLGSSRDPIAVMEAVRASADRVAIFCQAGNIAAPAQASDLFELVDPMIHEVRRPRRGHLFHPKLWILRFESQAEPMRFRALVLTRNLTGDRGWDLVVRLDDDPDVSRRNRDNDQLVRLLQALPALTRSPLPERRVEEIAALAERLGHVTWVPPEGVEEVRFWCMGVGRLPRPDLSGTRGLVMSPFLTEGGIRPLLACPDLTIVSRADELERFDSAALENATVYALDPMAGYGDPDEVDLVTSEPNGAGSAHREGVRPADPPGLRDLHAKLYVAERARRAHVFIGSANATEAAFGGNIELLCELVGRRAKLGVGSVLDADTGILSMLEPYEAGGVSVDEELEALERQLEELLRGAAELSYRAEVIASEEHWRVTVSSDEPLPPEAAEYTVSPLNRSTEQRRVAPGNLVAVDFGPRVAADLTAFYLLTARLPDERVQPRSTVVRAELIGAPPGRIDEIIARQVDTPEKFLRFLLLLLGAGGDIGIGVDGWEPGTGGTQWRVGATGIFELLATTLATRPHALDEVASLVERLSTTSSGRAVLPAGWEGIWSAVMEARRRLMTTR